MVTPSCASAATVSPFLSRVATCCGNTCPRATADPSHRPSESPHRRDSKGGSSRQGPRSVHDSSSRRSSSLHDSSLRHFFTIHHGGARAPFRSPLGRHVHPNPLRRRWRRRRRRRCARAMGGASPSGPRRPRASSARGGRGVLLRSRALVLHARGGGNCWQTKSCSPRRRRRARRNSGDSHPGLRGLPCARSYLLLIIQTLHASKTNKTNTKQTNNSKQQTTNN